MTQEAMQLDVPNSLARDRLKKHVAAIHTSGELSLLERKLSNVLLLNAYDDLLTRRTHQLPVVVLCEVLGWENSKNVSKLKAALTTLASTPVEFDMMKDGDKEEEDWSVTPILSYGAIKAGVCTYRYDEAMAERLFNPAIFSTISATLQRKFAGGYALALYENVNRYVRVGTTGYWDLPTLRKLLGVTQEYYDDFRRLNSKVIQKAVQEINKESDITITRVDLDKTGRTVTAVRFLVEAKPQSTLFKHNESPELEELKQLPTFARLREHGIGEPLALSFLAEDPERAERIVTLAEENAKKGRIRHTTAGFIRKLMETGADVQPSPPQRQRKEEADQLERTRRENALADLRKQFEARTKIAAMQALTHEQIVELAARFITTDDGRAYAKDFSQHKQEPFPAGSARVAFRKWLPTQVGLRLDDEAFEVWRAEQGGNI